MRFTMSDTKLGREARSIAIEALTDEARGGQFAEYGIAERCNDHEWVIYHHKALILCAECNTYDGEDIVGFSGNFGDIATHASIVARATLHSRADDWLYELDENRSDQYRNDAFKFDEMEASA